MGTNFVGHLSTEILFGDDQANIELLADLAGFDIFVMARLFCMLIENYMMFDQLYNDESEIIDNIFPDQPVLAEAVLRKFEKRFDYILSYLPSSVKELEVIKMTDNSIYVRGEANEHSPDFQ